MKKLFLLLLSGVALFISCSRVPDSNCSEDDLLATLTTEKAVASEYLRYHDICSVSGTKAGLPEEEPVVVPEWAYDYVLQYMEPDDIGSWDEVSICTSLANDFKLSSDEKHYVASMIGDLSAVKDVAIATINEKVEIKEKTPLEPEGRKMMSEDDCYRIYMTEVKWAIFENVGCGAAAGGALGGGLGVELGIIGGLIRAWNQIRQLGYDYIRCNA